MSVFDLVPDNFAAMMLGGLIIDAIVGWPDPLYRRIGHPVSWMGHLIQAGESRYNSGPRVSRLRGGFTTVVLLGAVTTALATLLQWALPDTTAGLIIGAFLTWPFIAARSMHDHVQAVAAPLSNDDLSQARKSVAMIVGRDPQYLDTPGVARAASESLAENTSDGIVAPIFWGVIAGLPGIALYKAINTADSMIGHRNERYEAFGKCAAKLDDLVNWIPARLTGLLFAIAAGRRLGRALTVMNDDARAHRSPNAGWPEAALAGALNIRLSGPRRYGNQITDEPWINTAGLDPSPRDLKRAVRLYLRTMTLTALALLALALIWDVHGTSGANL